MAKGSSPLSTSQRPTKFGMFYPRGYVIVTFKNEESADAVRQSLIGGGYDEEDYAPSDLDAERLMNVARRHGYLRAQKYDRFSFTEL